MPVQHTIETNYKTKEGTGKKASQVITADKGVHVEVTVPAGAVNLQVNLALDVSEIKGLNIGVGDGSMTVKTNSTSEPDDTLELDERKDVIWTPQDPAPCPLTTDVTALYITNNGADDADFYLQAAVDATPGVA